MQNRNKEVEHINQDKDEKDTAEYAKTQQSTQRRKQQQDERACGN